MRFIERFGKYVVTAVITFSVGLVCSSLTGRFSSSQPQTLSYAVINVQSRRPEIVSSQAGHRLTSDGFATSFSTHEYSDGSYLRQVSTFYASSERARAELEKRLQHASKIILRQPVFDEHGQQIGERVIATFQNEADAATAELLWTEHGRFVIQQRRSLEDLMLDFYEKR
jgi:hypothetical protein